MAHDKTFFSQQAHSSLTLVNYVHHDGIGDFRHLLDFVSFFNNTPVLKEIELICIVINSHKPGNPQSVYIKEQLESMNVTHKILITTPLMVMRIYDKKFKKIDHYENNYSILLESLILH
ncbi:hypothetical protein PGH43_09340 [Legionella pneumophila 130b]|nr:hypothetical protein PGH43_09340 [Legionella pneumophila 130b]WBV64842.1 hypothetical protein PGH44_09245 [Legionella pneumophila]